MIAPDARGLAIAVLALSSCGADHPEIRCAGAPPGTVTTVVDGLGSLCFVDARAREGLLLVGTEGWGVLDRTTRALIERVRFAGAEPTWETSKEPLRDASGGLAGFLRLPQGGNEGELARFGLDGRLEWKCERASCAPQEGGQPPRVVASCAFAGSDAVAAIAHEAACGRVHALSALGKELWSIDCGAAVLDGGLRSADLDRDGTAELYVLTARGLVIVDARGGLVRRLEQLDTSVYGELKALRDPEGWVRSIGYGGYGPREGSTTGPSLSAGFPRAFRLESPSADPIAESNPNGLSWHEGVLARSPEGREFFAVGELCFEQGVFVGFDGSHYDVWIGRGTGAPQWHGCFPPPAPKLVLHRACIACQVDWTRNELTLFVGFGPRLFELRQPVP